MKTPTRNTIQSASRRHHGGAASQGGNLASDLNGAYCAWAKRGTPATDYNCGPTTTTGGGWRAEHVCLLVNALDVIHRPNAVTEVATRVRLAFGSKEVARVELVEHRIKINGDHFGVVMVSRSNVCQPLEDKGDALLCLGGAHVISKAARTRAACGVWLAPEEDQVEKESAKAQSHIPHSSGNDQTGKEGEDGHGLGHGAAGEHAIDVTDLAIHHAGGALQCVGSPTQHRHDLIERGGLWGGRGLLGALFLDDLGGKVNAVIADGHQWRRNHVLGPKLVLSAEVADGVALARCVCDLHTSALHLCGLGGALGFGEFGPDQVPVIWPKILPSYRPP